MLFSPFPLAHLAVRDRLSIYYVARSQFQERLVGVVEHMTARMHNTVFFAGYARLPESVTGRDGEQVLGLELEVDPDTDLIVDLSCTAVLPLGAKFIKDLLVGHNLQETMDGPKKEIEWHYFSATQKAILAALDNVYERWQRYKKGIQEIERAKL